MLLNNIIIKSSSKFNNYEIIKEILWHFYLRLELESREYVGMFSTECSLRPGWFVYLSQSLLLIHSFHRISLSPFILFLFFLSSLFHASSYLSFLYWNIFFFFISKRFSSFVADITKGHHGWKTGYFGSRWCRKSMEEEIIC